ncbi:MAG: hypothetical protein L6V95_09015 [Candidatus Melainabacteria bacterium]|nr:MAG: hypothetical protein L6V95_09015 [Candidatus Melainabacteria bacterium]
MKIKFKNSIYNKLISIFGKDNVLTNQHELYAYAHDCSNIKSGNIKVPLAVVFPVDVYQVQKTCIACK